MISFSHYGARIRKTLSRTTTLRNPDHIPVTAQQYDATIQRINERTAPYFRANGVLRKQFPTNK